MLTFCTLFDSNYLDKGLVLHRSLTDAMPEFKLYILAMDDKCCEILNDLKLKNVIVISLPEFMDEELIKIREERTKAEFCWTCTASLIDYILEEYKEEYCTYIDSDLYFYKNPKLLIEEMCAADCSVQIVEHGFGTGKKAKLKEKNSGKYCVQFNTFKNDEHGREILGTWKRQCRERCSMEIDAMGDQKYLTDWDERYEKVHVLQHQGAGIAPWNVMRFCYDNTKNFLVDKKTKKKFEMIFYHFHHIEYIDKTHVNINVFKENLGVSKELVHGIYLPYLREIGEMQDMLYEKYGIASMLKNHPGLKKESSAEKWEKRRKMDAKEIIRRAGVKAVYLLGKRKDIIEIEG